MDKHDLTEDQKLVMWTLFIDSIPYMDWDSKCERFQEILNDMGQYYVQTVGEQLAENAKEILEAYKVGFRLLEHKRKRDKAAKR